VLRIGLTGGIGAGKSEVARRLADHSAFVIDADQLAREVVAPGTEGLLEVVAAFGTGMLNRDGGLDRAALAAAVFDDPSARRKLEAIVHPRVRERTRQLTEAAPPDAIVVNDVPLLVETGLAAAYHLVVVVEAAATTRLARLVASRGLTREQAEARIRAQASDADRRAAADGLLTNDRTLADLYAAVDATWRGRLVPFEANLRHRRRAPRPARAVLVAPEATWPAQAERLIARIRRAAADGPLRVDHIGSTSVPGLVAKDVLDVQVVLPDLAVAAEVAERLLAAGLVRQPGDWWDNGWDGRRHPKLMTMNADPGRAANVHLREVSSPAWRDALLLRDWLRATPSGVEEYAARKRDLAARPHDSIDAYAEAKTPWIASALARADAWAAGTGWRP